MPDTIDVQTDHELKERYISQQHALLIQSYFSRALVFGTLVFYMGSAIDFILSRDKFYHFLGFRIIINIVFVALYFINKQKASIWYQQSLIMVASAMATAIIEVIVLSSGGHVSLHFIGVIVVVIASVVIIPVTLAGAFVIFTIDYLVYMLPILIFDSTLQWSPFLVNLLFMTEILIFSFVARQASQKFLQNELGLRYDLAREKGRLEEAVADKTKDIKQSEQRLKALFDNATDGILIINDEGTIVDANNKAYQIYGYSASSLIGAKFVDLASEPGGVDKSNLDALLNGKSAYYESNHFKNDGKEVTLEISANAISIDNKKIVQAYLRDITDKKEQQKQLFESRKMSSIGLLAGGVAHDFRNFITSIYSFLDLLKSGKIGQNNLSEKIAILERNATKTGNIISQLLGYARKGDNVISVFNLNKTIQDCTQLFNTILLNDISVFTNLDENLPNVKGDSGQIENVIMNILQNARDSIQSEGHIMIKTYRTWADPSDFALPDDTPYGEYVALQISDTGCGIPDENLDKIFEPFFTTKERGKGTGLGLSMVWGVVSAHKGIVKVKSTVNRGSEFTILLPVCSDAVDLLPLTAVAPSAAAVAGHCDKTILFVDDDEALLTFTSDALKVNGYNVITTSNALHAIDMFEQHVNKIDIVITDIVMPEVDGMKLVDQIKVIQPDTKFIVISAYSKFNDIEKKQDITFLQKPFRIADLLTRLHQELDKDATPAV